MRIWNGVVSIATPGSVVAGAVSLTTPAGIRFTIPGIGSAAHRTDSADAEDSRDGVKRKPDRSFDHSVPPITA
jgi:hypothetical protein